MDDDYEWQEANDNQEVRNRSKLKDLVAFWIFGLCNNYGYVVMLTAAEDIINSRLVSIMESKIYLKLIRKCIFSLSVQMKDL